METLKIKVEYNYEDITSDEMLELDKKITEKIESIGAKWYAQGCGTTGTRDIYFDLKIKYIITK